MQFKNLHEPLINTLHHLPIGFLHINCAFVSERTSILLDDLSIQNVRALCKNLKILNHWRELKTKVLLHYSKLK